MAFVDFGGFLGAMPDYEARRRQAVQDFSGFGAAGLVGLDVYKKNQAQKRFQDIMDAWDYKYDPADEFDFDKTKAEQLELIRADEDEKYRKSLEEYEARESAQSPRQSPMTIGGPRGQMSPRLPVTDMVTNKIKEGEINLDDVSSGYEVGEKIQRPFTPVVTQEPAFAPLSEEQLEEMANERANQMYSDLFTDEDKAVYQRKRSIFDKGMSEADKYRKSAKMMSLYDPEKADEMLKYADEREKFEIQVGAEKEARQDQLRQSALIRTEQQIGELNSEILNLQQIRKGLSPDEQILINRVDNRVSSLGNEINRLQSAKKSLAAGGLLEDVYNEIPSFTLRDTEPKQPTAGYEPVEGNTEAGAEKEEALGIPTIEYKDDINKVEYKLKELVHEGKLSQEEADRLFGLAKLEVANVPVRGAAEKEAKRLRSSVLKFKNKEKSLIDKTDDVKIIKTLQSNYNKALGLVDEAKKGNASAAQSIIIFAVKSTDPDSAVMEGEGKAQQEQSYISQARDILKSISGQDPRTQARYIDDQITSIRKNTKGEMDTRLPSIISTISTSNAELLDIDKSFKDTLSLKDFGIIDNLSGTGKPEPKPAPEETSNIQPVGYTPDGEEIY